jgi:hypothetical protein
MPNSSPQEYRHYIERAAVLLDLGYVKDMSLYSLADLLERQDASLRRSDPNLRPDALPQPPPDIHRTT